MSHADTLQDMAKDLPIGGGPVAVHPHQNALLAGAAALDTLDRVRDALTKIDAAYQSAYGRWENDLSDTYASARADALSEAHHLIYDALGSSDGIQPK